MHDALTEIAIHIGVIAVLAMLVPLASGRRLHPGWLAVALALMLLRDGLVLRGYGLIPNLVPGPWAWTGKLLATAGLLLVAALPAFGLRRCGVTLRQAPGWRTAWAVFAALAAAIFAVAIAAGDGPDCLETIAFQWTMPGLEEELFYRGVLLLALNRALDGDGRPGLAGMGWGGVVACVAFGLGHALFWRNGMLSFDPLAMALTGGPALLLAWFRARTGSLLLPVLAHNVANGAPALF